ncbi:hypothetical protein SAMN04488063_1344 [Halopelagius inordinatus]|uniref:Alkylhydroperoxidase AhpD family core domain-containing protein n=1 Tax=Halopelagius inordinatus TaxID=553467 RepID=A0A1I2P1B6_9EURY|nr:alkylhydroperoxidase [Halopelagius inordinatus]SFG07496.1 hypothetical protein SAMN04488063_1344 [Halopelagius inordinatus]
MTSRIEPVSEETATEEWVVDLLEEAREGWYGDSAFFGAMAHQPELCRGLVDVLGQFPQSESLSPELLELVRLKVADAHRCAYCATVRTRAVEDDVAPKEEAVFGDVDTERLDERERQAVELAELLSGDPHRLTDDRFDSLRETFGESAVVELLLFVSLEVALDRFCIALTLDTTDESPYPTGLSYPFEGAE